MKTDERREEGPKTVRPFNLEEAKAGNPVITRDGRPVRILAFDIHGTAYCIVGAVSHQAGETVHPKNVQGRNTTLAELAIDLCMAPNKVVRWFNVYTSGAFDFFLGGTEGYPSKEEAFKCRTSSNNCYIKTVPIEVEL